MQQLSEQNKILLNKILVESKYSDRKYFDSLSDHEAKYVLQILQEYSIDGYSKLHSTLWELDYTEKPVSIEKFITDTDYFGKIGKTIYPKWQEELCIVLKEGSKTIEWLFTGSIGSGKTTVANVGQSYKSYRLMCLKNPAAYYDLMEEGVSTISLAFFNITIPLAEKVTFAKYQAMVKSSPWFKERIKLNINENVVKLTDHINIILGSRVTHAIGSDSVGALMDETDFSTSVDNTQVKEAYNAIHDRVTSRYLKYVHKEPPGIMTLISSTVQDEASFMNKRLKLAEQYPESTHVSSFAQWDVKPIPVELDTGKFTVFLGDNLNLPQIVQEHEKDKFDQESIIDVPNIYKKDFDDDIDKAILNLAGRRMGTRKNLFLKRVDKLNECLTGRTIFHPFNDESIFVSIDRPDPMQSYFDKSKFVKYNDNDNKYSPIISPNRERFIHVDLSKNKDFAGMSCVHCSGYIEKDIRVDDDNVKRHKLPLFYKDWCIQMKYVPGSEIDYEKINDFIYFISSIGVKIGGLSFDSYQSVGSLQNFKKSKICEESRIIELSVDKKPDPYKLFRELIMDRRISMYNHSILINEITKLVRDPDTDRVNHDGNLSTKDVTDSLVGAIEHCHRYYTSVDLGQIRMPLINASDYASNKDNIKNVMKYPNKNHPKI